MEDSLNSADMMSESPIWTHKLVSLCRWTTWPLKLYKACGSCLISFCLPPDVLPSIALLAWVQGCLTSFGMTVCISRSLLTSIRFKSAHCIWHPSAAIFFVLKQIHYRKAFLVTNECISYKGRFATWCRYCDWMIMSKVWNLQYAIMFFHQISTKSMYFI